MGCTSCGAAGDRYLQPNRHLQLILHLHQVWEPLSDQLGAQTGGFDCLSAPEDEEPLAPSLCSLQQRRRHRIHSFIPLLRPPSSQPLRAEQLPRAGGGSSGRPKSRSPSCRHGLGSFPAGAACQPDPRHGSRARALPLHRARAGGRQRTAGLTLPRQAEAKRSAAGESSWSDTICHPGPAWRCLPCPSQDGSPAQARPERTARVSQGQTDSMLRSGREASSAAVRYCSLQRFDLERGEGEGGSGPGSVESRQGLRFPFMLPPGSSHRSSHRSPPRLSHSLAHNLTPLWQARAAALPRSGKKRNPGSS